MSWRMIWKCDRCGREVEETKNRNSPLYEVRIHEESGNLGVSRREDSLCADCVGEFVSFLKEKK